MRSSIKWKITYSGSNGTINHWIGDPFEWDDDLFSDPYYKNINDYIKSNNIRLKKYTKRRGFSK